MSTTVDSLYAKHLGRPVIVIGGGPSAPSQWAALPEYVREDAVLIFANAHGFKLGLKPDYIVCKDDVHTETKKPMEPQLRAYGDYPIVARHEWADIKLEKNWPIQGNSGQLAIGLAALVGGKPIIPIGIDCYQQGTYFHSPNEKNVSGGRRESLWRSSMTRLMLRLEGAAIRAPSGILALMFPRYDPTERFPAPVVPKIFDRYRLLTSP